jgi:GntR family transcriptional regulator/MocR family aminotransferase
LKLLQAAGARVAHVPVDEHGMRVEQLLRRHADAQLALVTPAHQAPLGVSMSLQRRMQLLAWAQQRSAWIVEDDYDSEFRYTGAPLPAMKSADGVGRVLYAGTFSKVLFPGLSLAYLIVPWPQVPAFTQQVGMASNGCAAPLQEAVADFMEQGHFSRHIKKMRSLYAQRRQLLVQALEATFGTRVHIELQAGGMHLLVRMPEAGDDTLLASKAQAAGLAVQALSERCSARHAGQGLLMGFTNVASREQALSLAKKLRDAWGMTAARRSR